MMTHSYWFGSKLILGQLPRYWAIALPLQDDVTETTSDSGVRKLFAKFYEESRITMTPYKLIWQPIGVADNFKIIWVSL